MAFERVTVAAVQATPVVLDAEATIDKTVALLEAAAEVDQGGPQIWLAPTADDSDGWIASMRHIAVEAGAFVVSAPQYIPAAAFPADFPLPLPPDQPVFGRGGACIVAPSGNVIAGPVYDEEATIQAELDLRDALHAKRYFDVVGHYGRSDVLAPKIF